MSDKNKISSLDSERLKQAFKTKWGIIGSLAIVLFFVLSMIAFSEEEPDVLIFWIFTAVPVIIVGVFLDVRKLQKNREEIESLKSSVKNLEKESSKVREDSSREISKIKEESTNEALEIERQLAVKEFALSDHFAPFISQLESVKIDEIDGLTHTQFVQLYKALDDAFRRNKAVPLSKLASIPEDVKRVNQIETLIDLYGEKMSRVRNDENLEEEDRDLKIANWERLMERDIARLEEA